MQIIEYEYLRLKNYKEITEKNLSEVQSKFDNYGLIYQINKKKVGDSVIFGKYHINDDDKKESIEWIILEKSENNALLISKYILAGQYYDPSFECYGEWEKCSLRKWLNNEFIKEAFDQKEIMAIKNNDVTDDKVFILDEDEVFKYFKSSDTRKCKATICASKQYTLPELKDIWWLRGKRTNLNRSSFIDNDGLILRKWRWDSGKFGVRPVITVKL